jgi:DNA-binding winged helix-turn-helix (wHTH) protein
LRALLALAGCEPADKHAVEMTVARLRHALGLAAAVIQTVVKRGHRLDVQHGADWSAEPAVATVARCLP